MIDNDDMDKGEPLEERSPDMIGRATNKDYNASKEVRFKYDLENAPRGEMMLLLTVGGRCLPGMVTGRPERDWDIMGYFPYPGRDKEEEARRGLPKPAPRPIIRK